MWSNSPCEKLHRKLIVLMFLGLATSMPSDGENSSQPPYLTITDVLRKVEDLRSGWVPPTSKDHPHDDPPPNKINATRTTRQDEGDTGDVDPINTDAFQQITNSFGGILAQRLIGNILAPQTGDVREFLGGIAQNVVKFAFPRQTTTTTPKTSYLYQGTRIQQVDRQPGYLLNNVNPGYRPNRVPAPGQAIPVSSGQREPVRVPVQSVQVVRLDQIGPKTTPPPQKYFWGGDGGAVGKLVNGLVSGVANELGLVNRTQQSPPLYYLPAGGGGGIGQGQVGNINGGVALGSNNNGTDVVDSNSPTTESAGGGEDESDENRDINQNRKLSKFEWKLKHKYIPLSI